MRAGWTKKELGDVIDIKHGFAFKGEYITPTPNPNILLTPGNVMIGGGFQYGKGKYYTGPIPEDYVLQADDLIVSMTDLSKFGDTLGYSAKIPFNNKVRFLHNQRIGLVSLINDCADKEFIYWLMRTRDYQKYNVNRASGSSVKHTSPTTIKSFVFEIPPLPKQRAIAATLSCLDDKIELNNKINANLEAQAQAIFKSWFVDFEPFQDGEFVDSELGPIPKGFKLRPLYSFAEYINGTSFKKDDYAMFGTPIVKIAELKNGITDSTEYCGVEKDRKYYIKNKELLFSWSGNPDTSIDTFIWCGGDAILNQHTFRVIPNGNTYSFVYCLLRYFKPEFTRIASNKQTTGLGHVTMADLKRLLFAYSENFIAEFCNLITPIIDKIYFNMSENNTLAAIRDTLLPKLMGGEIEVPVRKEGK